MANKVIKCDEKLITDVLRELLKKLQNRKYTAAREFCSLEIEAYFMTVNESENGHIKGCNPSDGISSDVVDTCRCHFQLHVYPKKLMKEIANILLEDSD